jgi:hypothetical protein
MLPGGVRVILLADRGFGRTELARTCEDLKLRCLIRIKTVGRITHPSYTGRLDEYPIKKGLWRVLADAEYRSDKAVSLDVVIRWRKGLPAGRDGPWFLMTDREGNAVQLTDLYAKRVAVEELFRTRRVAATGWGWVRPR